ncbi:MAG TPA: hypothetical protein VMJ32_12860 [Pirellulales bacterium]|nr:hypothetical protein [Pirellulales bacterium]
MLDYHAEVKQISERVLPHARKLVGRGYAIRHQDGNWTGRYAKSFTKSYLQNHCGITGQWELMVAFSEMNECPQTLWLLNAAKRPLVLPTENDVAKIKAEHSPWLNDAWFHEVVECCEYLHHCEQTSRCNAGSYGLKHCVEERAYALGIWPGYVGSDSFTIAAMFCGFDWKRNGSDSWVSVRGKTLPDLNCPRHPDLITKETNKPISIYGVPQCLQD